MERPDRRRLIAAGALAMLVVAYASRKLVLIPPSYALYNGVVGGLVIGGSLVAGTDRTDVDAVIEYAILAGTLAGLATFGLFLLDDILLTTKYPQLLGTVSSEPTRLPPDPLVSKLMIYGVLNIIQGIVFVVTSTIGGVVGALASVYGVRTLRSYRD